MADLSLEKAAVPPQPVGAKIELLQVLSLLAVVLGTFLRIGGGRDLYVWLLYGAAIVLFGLPFILARVPESELVEYDENDHFTFTQERLRTLRELNVPVDLRHAIKDHLIGRYFDSAKSVKQELFRLLGKKRVTPWLNTILMYSKCD